MAVAFIQEFAIVDGDTSTTNYDSVAEKLRLSDAAPITGLIAHSAGFDHASGVFRIFDIWDDAADARRFYEERLGPIVGEMMQDNPSATPPLREATYELHDVIS